jgi:hypothetical protein
MESLSIRPCFFISREGRRRGGDVGANDERDGAVREGTDRGGNNQRQSLTRDLDENGKEPGRVRREGPHLKSH